MTTIRCLMLGAIGVCLMTPMVIADHPIPIGSRLEPFVDDDLIATMSGVELRLHKPMPREVVLVHDKPWEGNITAHHTVFRDGELFRMYYLAGHYDEQTKSSTVPRVMCYAESKDGIHWNRPEVGLFEFNGSKKNNIIWMGSALGYDVNSEHRNPISIFRDRNPKCQEDAKYKSIARGDDGVYALKSADGIHWKLISETPVVPKGSMTLDSMNLAFWDTTRNQYVCFLRNSIRRPGRDGVRGIVTAVSSDFVHWTKPVFLKYPGAPLEHLYTSQIAPYDRAPHIFLGFPKRYVPTRTAVQHQHSGVSDGVFMSSRDGLSFKRWGEAIIRPGPQQDCWVNRNHMTGWGILTTKSEIPGTPDDLSIYSTEGYYTGRDVKLRRFTYRIDGFVSVQAPLAGGELLTKPIVFSGHQLRLNFSTSAAGSIRVEIQDRAGRPIDGFALQDCPEMFADAIDRTVTWRNGSNVRSLAGKSIRLRIQLKDADLYAFQFGGG